MEESKTRKLAELVVLMASLKGKEIDGLFPVHQGEDEIVLGENQYKLRAAHAIGEREYGGTLERLAIDIEPTGEEDNRARVVYYSKGLTDECELFIGVSDGDKTVYRPDMKQGLEHADEVEAVMSGHLEKLLTHYEKATENVHSYVVQIRREGDAYSAEFPDVPECTTGAKNPEDALDAARDALSGVIASLIQDDEPIPAAEYQFGNAPEGVQDVRVTVGVTPYLDSE